MSTGIVSIMLALLTAFAPNALPETAQKASAPFLYDQRISMTLSYFNKDFPSHSYATAAHIALASKDWKRAREKNIRPLFGSQAVDITVWLFYEKSSTFSSLQRLFSKNLPQVSFSVREFANEEEYMAVLNQIARGQESPPDILMIKNGWWPTFKRQFAPIPDNLFSKSECVDFYYAFACDAFSTTNNIYALPVSVDAPFLLVNKGLLKDDRIATGDMPSEDWSGFLGNGQKFLYYFKSSAREYFTQMEPYQTEDNTLAVFNTLLLQAREKESISASTMEEVLQEILLSLDSFAYQKGKRSPTFVAKDTVRDRFLNGEIATFFAKRKDYEIVREHFIDSTGLKIKEGDIVMAPLPVISSGDELIVAGDAWGLAVPSKAKNKKEAFGFLAFLAEESSMQSLSRTLQGVSSRKVFAPDLFLQEMALSATNPLGQSGTYPFSLTFVKNIIPLFAGEKTPAEVAEIFLPFFPQS